MKTATTLILAALVAVAAGCSRESGKTQVAPAAAVAPVLTGPDAKDIHSYADPAVARVTHVDAAPSVDEAAAVLDDEAPVSEVRS